MTAAAEPPPPASPAPVATRRFGAVAPSLRPLLVIIGVALALLVVFRQVLFPFLLAAYVAYLLEPVVGWIEHLRTPGIRIGRGLAILLLYVLVIGGLVLLASWGVSRVGAEGRGAFQQLRQTLNQNRPAATLALEGEGSAEEVWVPKGTRLVDEAGHRFLTMFPAQIEIEDREARVLLEPDPETSPGARPIAGLKLAPDAAIELPAGLRIAARIEKTAGGLEVALEQKVISPISEQMEKMTGRHFDPQILRKALSDRVAGAEGTQRFGDRVMEWVYTALMRILLSTYQLVLVLMLTAFMVIDRRRIARYFASLPPTSLRHDYRVLMRYVDRGLSGVIRGQIVICFVNGFLTWLGLLMFSVPYAGLLSFVAGVFSLIPVFGTIASSIPIVLVALATSGVPTGLLALGWIALIHLLEANLFNPLIMGTSAGMHPIVIVFALLAGEHAFGVWGALLAVPTASLLLSCLKYYRHEVQGVPEEPHSRHGAWLRRLLERGKTRRAAPSAPPTEGGA